MTTLIGAFLIIGSCFALAVKSVQKQRERLWAVEDFSKLLYEMARTINFQLEPLPQILNRISQEDNPPVSGFLQEIKRAVQKDAHCPIDGLWQQALESFSKNKNLPEKAYRILKALGTQVGKMDMETETNRLKVAAKELHALYAELEKNTTKTEKLTKSLGIVLGISIVILLI